MTDMQRAVLSVVERVCSVDIGFYTSEIAAMVGRQPGHESNAKHSALVLRELLALEAAHKVARLDKKKPIVWCKAE